MDLGPGVSGCRALEVLGLVLMHWCAGLGPGAAVALGGRKEAGLLVDGALLWLAAWPEVSQY